MKMFSKAAIVSAVAFMSVSALASEHKCVGGGKAGAMVCDAKDAKAKKQDDCKVTATVDHDMNQMVFTKTKAECDAIMKAKK